MPRGYLSKRVNDLIAGEPPFPAVASLSGNDLRSESGAQLLNLRIYLRVYIIVEHQPKV